MPGRARFAASWRDWRLKGLPDCWGEVPMNSRKSLVPVRLEVGVLLQIVQQGAGPDPERQAAVSAVVGEVAGTEAAEGEALDEVIPPLVRGVAHQQLVGPGAVLRVGRVERLGEVANGPQPINLALAKQIAPSTTSATSCSKGILCQRPLPRDPTRLRQRVTRYGLSSCSSMALPGRRRWSARPAPFLVAAGSEQRLLDRGLEVDVMAGGGG